MKEFELNVINLKRSGLSMNIDNSLVINKEIEKMQRALKQIESLCNEGNTEKENLLLYECIRSYLNVMEEFVSTVKANFLLTTSMAQFIIRCEQLENYTEFIEKNPQYKF